MRGYIGYYDEISRDPEIPEGDEPERLDPLTRDRLVLKMWMYVSPGPP